MLTLSTSRANFEELKKNPLLFLNKETTYYSDGTERTIWKSLNKNFEGEFSDREIRGVKLRDLLIVAGNEVKDQASSNGTLDFLKFEINFANPLNHNHWCAVINSYIYRSKDKDDKYPYIHLLWFINHYSWDITALINAIKSYDITIQPFIYKILSKIGRCLSYNKQTQLVTVLGHFNYEYKVYYPSIIPSALDRINPKIENEKDRNLFSLVDNILGIYEDNKYYEGVRRNRGEDPSNPLLSLYHWFNKDNYRFDYKNLKPLFSLVSSSKRLNIVKRYFHDIRLNKTELDDALLEEFKDNKFSDFIRYRYCIYSPDSPINLCAPLLCDCLSTIKTTKGESFQSFDGILDFAIRHCDVANPSINLGLEFFIPKCQGGAVYNPAFVGFIDYGLVCELDEEQLNETNLSSYIYDLLDTNAEHITYDACSFDNTPISSEQLKLCKNNSGKVGLSCSKVMIYKDRWYINKQNVDWVNLFLTEPLVLTYNTDKKLILSSQISTKVFADNIRKLAYRYKIENSTNYFLISEELKKFEANILLRFSKPINIRIFPNKSSILGSEFNIFGIQNSNIIEDEESKIVYNRVIDSLRKELSIDYNGNFFEIPYNKEKLENLKTLYYYKGAASEIRFDFERTFLHKYKLVNTYFCAPKHAEIHNKAIDAPFFWCRGKECFKNRLDQHVLENCSDWRKYSLYHLVEILGYSKLNKVEAGYEPDDVVIKFIAIANKVVKKFNRLKCRDCGHLMRVHKNNFYNKLNYYSCYNPTCTQYNKEVYLNYCYKCKKGLIDSRDNAKCPNGWHICPDCHSCCNDDQFEKIAQKYIIANKTIPERMKAIIQKGGHNNKGIYFCDKCGNELKTIKENDEQFLVCNKCRTKVSNNS